MFSKNNKECSQVSTVHAAGITVVTSNKSRVLLLNKWTKQRVNKKQMPLPVLRKDSLNILLHELSAHFSNPTCSQPARDVWLVLFPMDLDLMHTVNTADNALAISISEQKKNLRTFKNI